MPIETTEKYIRARVRLPGEFTPGSFRTIDIDKGKGIKAVIGRLKGKDTTTAQSYLFAKGSWSVSKVRTWLKNHKLTVKAERLSDDGTETLDVAPEENLIFGFDDMNVKEEADDEDPEKKKHLYVEGYFSTTDKDRMGDVITKEFYEYNIRKGYIKQAATVLLNHKPDEPIGKLVKYELREKSKGKWGLWVRAEISNAGDVKDVRTKIKEGVLNAFSFRWRSVPGGEEPLHKDNSPAAMIGLGPRRVKAGIIIESSIVSLPANPKSAIDRWYEKQLPMPDAQAVAEAEALGQVDAVAAAVVKALQDAGVKVPESKPVPATGDIKGEKDTVMDEKFIKNLIAKMTPAVWESLDKETKDACLAVDGGIQARLDNAKLAEENASLKKQIEADAKAKADAEAKAKADAAAAAGTTDGDAAAKAKAEAEAKAKAEAAKADAGKPLTKDDVKEIVTETLKALAGKSNRKSMDPDGGNINTGAFLTGGKDDNLRAMFSGATPEGRDLSPDEVMSMIVDQYFVPGTTRERRQQLDELVRKIGAGEAILTE